MHCCVDEGPQGQLELIGVIKGARLDSDGLQIRFPLRTGRLCYLGYNGNLLMETLLGFGGR